MSDVPVCSLCGEPMPPSEIMFKYHGFSGPCPKPPKTYAAAETFVRECLRIFGQVKDDRTVAEITNKVIRALPPELSATKEGA